MQYHKRGIENQYSKKQIQNGFSTYYKSPNPDRYTLFIHFRKNDTHYGLILQFWP